MIKRNLTLETDTMSPEDMAHYLMDFCHCHLAAGNGCPGCRSISRPVTMAMENAVSVFLPTGTFEEEK